MIDSERRAQKLLSKVKTVFPAPVDFVSCKRGLGLVALGIGFRR